MLMGCQQSLIPPFSQSRLQNARVYQAHLKQIQTKVNASTLKRLKLAKPDVQDVRWLTFEHLEQNALGTAVHRLDLTAKVFQFSFGKSWYKAFRLPQSTKPIRLVIYSYAENGMGAGTIFSPTLVFLDYAFHISRVLTPEMKDVDSMLMKLQGEVMLNQSKSQEAYVIVATSDTLLQGSSSMLSIASVGFEDIKDPYAKTGIPNMQYVIQERAHSPVGSIKIFWETMEKAVTISK